MTGVLTDVFGAPVTLQRAGQAAVTLRAVFRQEPVEVARGDGSAVLISAPTLKIRADTLADAFGELRRGDLVQPSLRPGVTFRVANHIPSGSPASDAFVMVELEDVA